MVSPFLITAFALIPMAASIIAGLFASFYVFPTNLMSSLQHFVAGIVIGSVATELLPKILGQGSPWSIGISFVLGVLVILSVHEFGDFLSKKTADSNMPMGIIMGSALDLFIDGLLIGVSFLAGMSGGILIAVSLSFCSFFLVLALSSSLTKKGFNKKYQYLIIILTTLMLPIGALFGSTIIVHLPQQVLVETLAFGVAALLFLGVEELLAKAHERHDTAWISSCFFIGFLVILLFQA